MNKLRLLRICRLVLFFILVALIASLYQGRNPLYSLGYKPQDTIYVVTSDSTTHLDIKWVKDDTTYTIEIVE